MAMLHFRNPARKPSEFLCFRANARNGRAPAVLLDMMGCEISEVPMKTEDEYLRRANEAQQWADQAKSDKAKAAWLRIAQNWLGLFHGLERLAERPETHQEDHSASH